MPFAFFAARHVGSCSTWCPPELQVFFCHAVLLLGSLWHVLVLVHVIVPPEVQGFVPCLPLVVRRLLCFVWQCDIQHIHQSLQFGVISRLAKGTHCPIIWIVNEDVEQDWTQF